MGGVAGVRAPAADACGKAVAGVSERRVADLGDIGERKLRIEGVPESSNDLFGGMRDGVRSEARSGCGS